MVFDGICNELLPMAKVAMPVFAQVVCANGHLCPQTDGARPSAQYKTLRLGQPGRSIPEPDRAPGYAWPEWGFQGCNSFFALPDTME